MGFWDSMKGVGRAVGGLLETGIKVMGPQIASAAAGALAQKINPAGNYGGGYQPTMGYLPTPAYSGGGQVSVGGYTLAPAPAASVPYTSFNQIQPQVPQTWTPLPVAPVAPTFQQASYGGTMPAFATYATAMSPGTSGGGIASELMERFTGAVQGATGGLPTMFTYGQARARPVSEITAQNPVTGKMAVWKYMGRPILYSGDLATCKRVGRIARRVARRRPR